MNPTYNTTGTGAPAGAGGAYDSHHSSTIGTAHPSTGDKVAAMVPGTEQNKEKKALDAQYGTTGTGATTGGAGYGSTTHGHTGHTGTGAGAAGLGHSTTGTHGTHSSTIGTGHPSTGDKVAAMVPGTEQNKEKKALDNQYGTTGTGATTVPTTGGAGYGSTTTTHGHTGHADRGAAGLGHSTTGTHGTHSSTIGTGHPSTGDKVAAMVPGTEQNKEKKALDAQYGTTGTGASTGTHGAHGTHAHGTHGAHAHGTHGGAVAGAESHVPGTTEHKATHGGAAVGSGTHGTHTGATHHDTTHTGTHGHHGHDATTSSANKPSMADKIGGKIDVAIGKMTHNEGKVVQGEIKQTEGKAGLAHAGLGAGTGTGTGPTTTGTHGAATGTGY